MSASATTFRSSAQDIMFPAFMVGDKSTCRRKLKAEAKKWAKYYLEGREFPEPKLVPIPPGSIVFTDGGTADLVSLGYNFIPNTNMVTIDGASAKQEQRHIQCRAFTLMNLQFETEWAAKLETRAEEQAFRRAFTPFVCKFPWGAISMSILGVLFNSIQFTIPRIEAVLRYWETLDALQYINLHTYPISLSELMVYYFGGQIEMWVDHPTGNVRTDLQSAVEQMRQVPQEEIEPRLVRRLQKLVDSIPDLKHRDWLKLPGIIEGALERKKRYNQASFDDLTSGQFGGHRGFLRVLERDQCPDSDQFDPSIAENM